MNGRNVWNQSFLKLAQYPIAETERLLLRPVTLDDAEAMFECASDKKKGDSLGRKANYKVKGR